jgi:dihydropteroate synthase
MGVLNITPDSFSDGGKYLSHEVALERARQMIAEGADILDVGGESTRPGALDVEEDEELRRVLPVVEAIAGLGVPVSIDTRKPAVAKACLEAGARIVNDVTGLRDPGMPGVIGKHGAACVIMHMRGDPRSMQSETTYTDVIREVSGFLAERTRAARAAGVTDIAIDPGIGFAKKLEHNFEILKRFSEFTRLGFPVVAGPSRKKFLSTLADMEPVENRLEGTVAAVAIAVMHGAKVIRVHDVAACRRAIAVAEAVRRA